MPFKLDLVMSELLSEKDKILAHPKQSFWDSLKGYKAQYLIMLGLILPLSFTSFFPLPHPWIIRLWPIFAAYAFVLANILNFVVYDSNKMLKPGAAVEYKQRRIESNRKGVILIVDILAKCGISSLEGVNALLIELEKVLEKKRITFLQTIPTILISIFFVDPVNTWMNSLDADPTRKLISYLVIGFILTVSLPFIRTYIAWLKGIPNYEFLYKCLQEAKYYYSALEKKEA